MENNPHGILEEITPLSKTDCFYVIERRKTEFTFPLHRHKEYELNFIENASGARRIVGDSIEEIGNFDMVLITSPNLEHVWETYHCTTGDIREITVQFSEDLFNNNLFERNQFASIRKMLQRAQKGLAFPLPTILRVHSLLNSLTKADGFYSVIDFLMLLYQLSISDDARELSSSSFVQCQQSTQSERIKMVDQYLKDHMNQKISVSDVADLISMSTVSFCRFFKQHTGKSFTDYLIDVRIGNVIRLLVNTDKTISEICYECGFNNISNFNRLFKKKKGCSPKLFRETYIKKKILY